MLDAHHVNIPPVLRLTRRLVTLPRIRDDDVALMFVILRVQRCLETLNCITSFADQERNIFYGDFNLLLARVDLAPPGGLVPGPLGVVVRLVPVVVPATTAARRRTAAFLTLIQRRVRIARLPRRRVAVKDLALKFSFYPTSRQRRQRRRLRSSRRLLFFSRVALLGELSFVEKTFVVHETFTEVSVRLFLLTFIFTSLRPPTFP